LNDMDIRIFQIGRGKSVQRLRLPFSQNLVNKTRELDREVLGVQTFRLERENGRLGSDPLPDLFPQGNA
jgi:hypothetical protein